MSAVKFVSYDQFPRYLVGTDGSVIDMVTKRPAPKTSSRGYVVVILRDVNNKETRIGHHRLLGLCFLDAPGCVDELVINHKNGVKDYNPLSNLEWCTNKQNVYHAGMIGISKKCIPIEARNIDTGEIINFGSMIECARYLNIHKDSMQYRLKNGPAYSYPERFQYRRRGDDRPWGVYTSSKILVRELKTGKVRLFSTQRELCLHYGHSEGAFSVWLRMEDQPVLPGYIQVKRETDDSPWREVEVPEFELAKHNKTTPIRVIDTVTSRVKLFSSARECADAFQIKVTTLNERLNFNGKKTFNGRIFQRVRVV